MKIEGRTEIDGSVPIVWQHLLEPNALRGTIPGCRTLELQNGRAYHGEFELADGPFGGRYSGTAVVSDVVEHESYHLQLSGLGPFGPVEGAGRVWLESDDTHTIIHYEGEVAALGGPAQTHQRLLKSTLQAFMRRYFENVRARVTHRTRIHTTDLQQEAPPEPTAVARRNQLGVDDLIADIRYEVRRDRRILVFVAILGVLFTLLSLGTFVFIRSTYRWVIHYLAVRTNIIPENFPLHTGENSP